MTWLDSLNKIFLHSVLFVLLKNLRLPGISISFPRVSCKFETFHYPTSLFLVDTWGFLFHHTGSRTFYLTHPSLGKFLFSPTFPPLYLSQSINVTCHSPSLAWHQRRKTEKEKTHFHNMLSNICHNLYLIWWRDQREKTLIVEKNQLMSWMICTTLEIYLKKNEFYYSLKSSKE